MRNDVERISVDRVLALSIFDHRNSLRSIKRFHHQPGIAGARRVLSWAPRRRSSFLQLVQEADKHLLLRRLQFKIAVAHQLRLAAMRQHRVTQRGGAAIVQIALAQAEAH